MLKGDDDIDIMRTYSSSCSHKNEQDESSCVQWKSAWTGTAKSSRYVMPGACGPGMHEEEEGQEHDMTELMLWPVRSGASPTPINLS
jgi:hypothetical protein